MSREMEREEEENIVGQALVEMGFAPGAKLSPTQWVLVADYVTKKQALLDPQEDDEVLIGQA